ncbi:LuxR C-terminal-related transcriptional regulator [Nocardia sienata]|uniref:LuxR C-terminal-related transcriptional regulator n=1 Tax=Nocardia sienata TaxID=248552 RepID=UPI0007A510CC|nr:LuxR C-terminal-related transcriptional regulator [Nocardia sienata]
MGSAAELDSRVRTVLANLNNLPADDRAIGETAVSTQEALDEAWTAIADALAKTEGHPHRALLDALNRLRLLDRALTRAGEARSAEIGRRMGDVLAQLEAIPCSVRAIVEAAPRLAAQLGFDRAIVSRIQDNLWISEQVYIVDDPGWAESINRAGQESPQALFPGLFESEMVRRRQAILVHDVQNQSRVHRRIAEESMSRSYVAAPIVSSGRVVGFIHGDRYLQGRDTDTLDRDALRTFTEGLRLTLTRAALAERLDNADSMLREAVAVTSAALEATLDVDLARPAQHDHSAAQPVMLPRPSVPAQVRDRLTKREVQILEMMAQGRTNSSIAGELVISEGTVKQHVKHILRKLGVPNRAGAVARMYDNR